MKRIQAPTATGSLPAAAESGTTGYFTQGDPGVPTPATVVTPEWLNRVQEELCETIEGAGLTLDGNDNTQLKQAIEALAAAVAIPNGAQVGYARNASGARTDIANGTYTEIPDDGTTPLVTEGASTGLAVSHACASATNIVEVTVSLEANFGSVARSVIAVFAGNTCIGVCDVGDSSGSGGGSRHNITVVHAPASTSSISYSARVSASAGTIALNQNEAGNDYGTMHRSTIIVREIKAS